MKRDQKYCQKCHRKCSRTNFSRHKCIESFLSDDPFRMKMKFAELPLDHQIQCDCGQILTKRKLKKHKQKSCIRTKIKYDKEELRVISPSDAVLKLINYKAKQSLKVRCEYCCRRMFSRYLKRHLKNCKGQKILDKNKKKYYENFHLRRSKEIRILLKSLKMQPSPKPDKTEIEEIHTIEDKVDQFIKHAIELKRKSLKRGEIPQEIFKRLYLNTIEKKKKDGKVDIVQDSEQTIASGSTAESKGELKMMDFCAMFEVTDRFTIMS